MRSVRGDIAAFARRYGLRQGVEAAAIIKAARQVLPTVLPEILHDQVVVQAYKDGVLHLATKSGSPLATLQQYKRPLLDQLKKKLGRAVVERVVVKPELNSSVGPLV